MARPNRSREATDKKYFRITVKGGIQDRLDVCP